MGTKYYGASLTFYEKYTQSLTENQLEKLDLSTDFLDSEQTNDPVSEDSDNQQSKEKVFLKRKSFNAIIFQAVYYCNKSICIVSRYPFFESFRKFLHFICGVSMSGPQKIPIERYISHLVRVILKNHNDESNNR